MTHNDRLNEMLSNFPPLLKLRYLSSNMTIDEIAKLGVTRLDEVEDLIKSARWDAEGGFNLWCKNEGKHLNEKEQQAELKARKARYIDLCIEKHELEMRNKQCHPMT